MLINLKIMKVMKYFAVTSLALLAACSNEEELTKSHRNNRFLVSNFPNLQ